MCQLSVSQVLALSFEVALQKLWVCDVLRAFCFVRIWKKSSPFHLRCFNGWMINLIWVQQNMYQTRFQQCSCQKQAIVPAVLLDVSAIKQVFLAARPSSH
jgi:hypothetical protein